MEISNLTPHCIISRCVKSHLLWWAHGQEMPSDNATDSGWLFGFFWTWVKRGGGAGRRQPENETSGRQANRLAHALSNDHLPSHASKLQLTHEMLAPGGQNIGPKLLKIWASRVQNIGTWCPIFWHYFFHGGSISCRKDMAIEHQYVSRMTCLSLCRCTAALLILVRTMVESVMPAAALLIRHMFAVRWQAPIRG